MELNVTPIYLPIRYGKVSIQEIPKNKKVTRSTMKRQLKLEATYRDALAIAAPLYKELGSMREVSRRMGRSHCYLASIKFDRPDLWKEYMK